MLLRHRSFAWDGVSVWCSQVCVSWTNSLAKQQREITKNTSYFGMENMWRMVTVKLLHACTTHMIVASSIDILRCKQALTSIPCEVLVIKILFFFVAVLTSGSFSIQCYLGSYKSISLLSTGNVNICCCRCDKQGSSLCLGSTEPCHLVPAYVGLGK